MNWVELLNQHKKTIQLHGNNRWDDYHAEITNQDTLVITLGDSWTWGDSLDADLRLKQVYGRRIADYYQADWINIGAKGFSNSWILTHLDCIMNILDSNISYKKILVVITLTENARDICSPETCKYDYISKFKQLGNTENFYNQILVDFENQWIQQIQQAVNRSDSRYVFFVGQNFVWHQQLYDQLQNTQVCQSDLNWIEVLSDYQQLARPVRTTLVTGWVWSFNLEKINSIVNNPDNTVYKTWILPFLDQANLVNQWLDASALNHKKASKHPTALGHQIWAEHIINHI